MSQIVIELTNRCNLNCKHCFDGRHGGNEDINVETVEKVLRDSKSHGFDNISYTGGEPTLHENFIDVLKITGDAGYKFGFVTNGLSFTGIYTTLLQYREKLSVVTFSLDSAREEIHDRVRGKGSYRKVMQAASICVAKDIPFTFNTVITSLNHKELGEVAELAYNLGSLGLRFGHLIPTPLNTTEKMNLSPPELREAEATIMKLQRSFQMPVVMAPGFYTDDLFPCAALKMEEFNIDWRGNVTMCCNISGHGLKQNDEGVINNLNKVSFSEAYEHLIKFNNKFCEEKLRLHNEGNLSDSDYFPCSYCLKYF